MDKAFCGFSSAFERLDTMPYEVNEDGKTNRIVWLGKKLYIEMKDKKLKPLGDWSGNFVKKKLFDDEVDYLLEHACGTVLFFVHCLFFVLVYLDYIFQVNLFFFQEKNH